MYTIEFRIFLILIIKKLGNLLCSCNIADKFFYEYYFKTYNCKKVYSSHDLENFKSKNIGISEKCKVFDEKVVKNNIKSGTKKGYCSCCGSKTNFIWQIRPEFSTHIMYTEAYYCPKCLMFNRVRAIIHIFKRFEKNPKNKKIYCYEQTTPFYENIRKLYSKYNEVIGSEYFGSDKTPGSYINGIRHEDSMNLSFSDNELDYIFSNDVFEHVPDIDKTLQEALRCLKPGGKLLFRVPVEWKVEKTIKRADIINGETVYYTDKEYHGGFSYNDPNGCLAFYTYGCDIFDIMKKIGFKDCYGIAIQDKHFVNIGIDPVVVFVCEK